MSSRYFTNALLALLGGVVVVLSRSLSSSTAIAWSAFGIAIAVAATSGLFQFEARRGAAQRLVDVAMFAVSGTLIGVSLVFSGVTVAWLAFALGIGIVGVGYVGLTLHEIEDWRAAHRLGRLHLLGRETMPMREEFPTRREETESRAA